MRQLRCIRLRRYWFRLSDSRSLLVDFRCPHRPGKPSLMRPKDFEQITAEEFLVMAQRSLGDPKSKLAFKELGDFLDSLPLTRERLAFEMADLASRSLDRGAEPAMA